MLQFISYNLCSCIHCFLHRKEIALSVAYLCSMSMTTNKTLGTPYWEWLLVVPLLHELQSPDGKQVDQMFIDPEKPDWGTHGLNREKLYDFRSYVQFKKYATVCFITDTKHYQKSLHVNL